MSRYDIYMHNKPQEDTTPISSASPQNNNTASPSSSVKSTVLIGYAALTARTATRTLTGQIKANGNEKMANSINNLVNIGGRLTLIAATGGWAAIPMAIEGIAEGVNRRLDRERENKQTEIENKLRGSRVGFMNGGAFND